ncbi:MAG: MFS transporter [Nitrospiraceae bacterium]|nr:MFS transporter [Nitrospiraceae bacterium]
MFTYIVRALSGLRLDFAVLRSLKNRNYRLFFVGQGVSLIGTWMQQIAMSWLVYRLTGSALLLGVVGFSGRIPSFLLAPVAGVLADRWNRRRLLVVTQSLAMLQAFCLSALILTKTITIWQLIMFSVILGCVNSFDIPTRQAFVVEMLEKKEDLGNAIALNSSLVNGARLIGPAIAGILIAAVGEGICFLLNGISYIAVIAALLMMGIRKPAAQAQAKKGFMHELREGFSYAFGFSPIRHILLLLALMSFMGMPYQVLMPIFAGGILKGGPHTLGFLMGASGLGALGGAVFLASRKSSPRLGMTTPLAAAVFGVGLMVFSQSRLLWLSLPVISVAGFGMMVQMASSNMILQSIVDDRRRGRVMSLFTMAFMGMVPFGSLLAGWLASRIGAPSTLFASGFCCVAGALLFSTRLPALKKELAPVYEQKGIA